MQRTLAPRLWRVLRQSVPAARRAQWEEKLPEQLPYIVHSLNAIEEIEQRLKPQASREATLMHKQQWTDGPVHVRQRKHKVSRVPWVSRQTRLSLPKHLDTTWATLQSPTLCSPHARF